MTIDLNDEDTITSCILSLDEEALEMMMSLLLMKESFLLMLIVTLDEEALLVMI